MNHPLLSFGWARAAGKTLTARAQATADACRAARGFELSELREVKLGAHLCDVLIVDVCNDQVPSRSPHGIRPREPLALVFPRDPSAAPQVRALRADFPQVPHLNHVSSNEPKWLCLDFEPWSELSRRWTPQRHLERILWWLEETAKGRLHRDDQPLEPFYFASSIDIRVPRDIEQLAATYTFAVEPQSFVTRGPDAVSGRLVVLGQAPSQVPIVPLFLRVPPLIHGVIEIRPNTLGELDDQLRARGSGLIEVLRASVLKARDARARISTASSPSCLLLVHLELQRSPGVPPERTELKGFATARSLDDLGVGAGVLERHNGATGKLLIADVAKKTWRDLTIDPCNVHFDLEPANLRAFSGVSENGASDSYVLAGVGALGSHLAEIWAREGWGRWTFLDEDYVQPHNTCRHIALDSDIGRSKVAVVAKRVQSILKPGAIVASPHVASAVSQSPEVLDAVKQAKLVVDATTSLEVPRELARRGESPRLASVFVAPSGHDSVLLIEDQNRSLRLDAIEAQYYGAVIASQWGERHLGRSGPGLWVGAGCRDVTVIMSTETIELHAALLARRIRLASTQGNALAAVWRHDDVTGAIAREDVPLHEGVTDDQGGWCVVSHKGIEEKLRHLRSARLPVETGGVILGYQDHVSRRVYVVDVLPQPPDSVGEVTGFVRGVTGLQESIREASHRTADVVGYVGEWHSHPAGSRPTPSTHDRQLLDHLSAELAAEGDPALMIIIGHQGEVTYKLKAQV